jgi:hypothetical protein
MNRDDRSTFNENNIAEFRASGGRISSFGDASVLLLTTTCAKSGKRGTNSLMYLADDDAPHRADVFASAAGADNDPDWFPSLVAHPTELTAEIGDETSQRTRRSCRSRCPARSSPCRRAATQASPAIRQRHRVRSPSSRSICTAGAPHSSGS